MTVERAISQETRHGQNGAGGAPEDFSTREKRARYQTERYQGATGLNWYTTDPSLQRTLRYYMHADDLAWAEPHLAHLSDSVLGEYAVAIDE